MPSGYLHTYISKVSTNSKTSQGFLVCALKSTQVAKIKWCELLFAEYDAFVF